jgi:hypothetical protein
MIHRVISRLATDGITVKYFVIFYIYNTHEI